VANLVRTLDVRAALIPERNAAIDDFLRTGWQVHLNFSLVMVYEGWTASMPSCFDK
jgi:hypothetical protein